MQPLLILVMIAAMFVFVLCWAMAWMGIESKHVMIVSMGVAASSTSLLLLGEAPMPSWAQGRQWRPRPGYRVVVHGRLTSLGAGIWFGVGGVAFLGAGWLTEHIVPGILTTFAAGFVLAIAGFWYDRRRAAAVRALVRRRGWLMAPHRAEGDLSVVEAQRRQVVREELCRSIQSNLTGRTTLERIETQHRYLVDDVGPPMADFAKDSSEVAAEWRTFRSAFVEGDQIWEFNTVSMRLGVASGEQGFALVRHAAVVDWFITAVVG